MKMIYCLIILGLISQRNGVFAAEVPLSQQAQQLCEAFGKTCGLLACEVPPPQRVELVTQLSASLTAKLSQISESVTQTTQGLNVANAERDKLKLQLGELNKNTDLFVLMRDFADLKTLEPLKDKIKELDEQREKYAQKLGGTSENINRSMAAMKTASDALAVDLRIASSFAKQVDAKGGRLGSYLRVVPKAEQGNDDSLTVPTPAAQVRSSQVLAAYAASNLELDIEFMNSSSPKRLIFRTSKNPNNQLTRYVGIDSTYGVGLSSPLSKAVTEDTHFGGTTTLEFEKIDGQTSQAKFQQLVDFMLKG